MLTSMPGKGDIYSKLLGVQAVTTPVENSLAVSLDTAIPFLGFLPMDCTAQRYMHIISIVALLIIGRNWKQPRCLSAVY